MFSFQHNPTASIMVRTHYNLKSIWLNVPTIKIRLRINVIVDVLEPELAGPCVKSIGRQSRYAITDMWSDLSNWCQQIFQTLEKFSVWIKISRQIIPSPNETLHLQSNEVYFPFLIFKYIHKSIMCNSWTQCQVLCKW